MRQADSKEYAHELVELLSASQVASAIELLESIVGTSHLALAELPADEGSLAEESEILGHGQVVSHPDFLAAHGGPAED